MRTAGSKSSGRPKTGSGSRASADQRPHVAIMDVRMPHRDGVANIGHLRPTSAHWHRHVFRTWGIVMYSANSLQAEDALNLGADPGIPRAIPSPPFWTAPR